MLEKTWKILPKKSDDLITQLLINRGLEKKEDIEKFFNPSLNHYKKKLEIPNIKKAQERIFEAIKKQELIIIYGDYDVDGITASAILYKALSSLGAKVLPYIPHREKEGYGLSKLGLGFARDSGASVVITVDNGIVAIEQAEFAKEIGLDLIITDHHVPFDSAQGEPSYPEALAIVHTIEMCGAGVAWCLVKDMITQDLARELLQFVALATVADMISLLGLGRAFVSEGLKVLRRSKNLGLNALADDAGLNLSEVGSYEIGHIIGPRLNAIGRLDHAIDALRLLCTKDPSKAKNLAELLSNANTKRQVLTEQAFGEARVLINKNSTKKIHILASSNWSPGIIGLIAARICEEYDRPAVAISVGPSHSRGSARSISGVNIISVIRKCSDILIDVGGHKGAAGFTIQNEYLEDFRNRVENLLENLPPLSGQTLEIEAEIESQNLTKDLVKKLEKFEPFGMLNPRPLLATKEMGLTNLRTVGQGKHLKGKADNIDFIAFGMGGRKDLINSRTQKADLAYCLDLNKFNGSETLQLKVKDIC